MTKENRDRIVPYLERLFGYAWALTKTDDRAHDLVQDAACKALSARRTPADDTAYRAWLFKILRNQFFDDRRRAHVMDKRAIESDENNFDAMEYWTGDERLINKIAVKRALTILTPKHSEILILIDMAGFRYQEASDLLDVPVGTVMSRLNRARATLLTLLESDGDNVVAFSTRRTGRG
jgi:RNA polymerase sigma-70 factor, ECF subfamily